MTTVLIIDDNKDVRFTIKEICQFSNWEVIEAGTGFEGVHLFRENHPDVVLVDFHLPNWDGVKTVQEMRKMNEYIPIIVLTVDERYEVADKFFSVGATDFALKPIKAPDLISRIRLNLKAAKLMNINQDVFVDKGINPETLGMVKDFMRGETEPITINQIQQKLPLAYQTVHRYLNYLVENDEVEVIAHYGKVGRPKNKYLLK